MDRVEEGCVVFCAVSDGGGDGGLQVAESLGLGVAQDSNTVFDKSDVVVLAVKPNLVRCILVCVCVCVCGVESRVTI